MVDAESGVAEYGVGGGITFDSSASGEFDETVAKARVLTARRPSFELLETMRRDPGEPIRRLPQHLDRLGASAAYFGFAFDEEAVHAALTAAGEGSERPVRVRLRLARSGATDIAVTPFDRGAPEPVRLEMDDVPVDPSDVFLFHKTTLRRRYEDARARHPDADDALLVNTRGEITETTVANVAAKLDGRWWTPPLDAGLLPGTERAALLADGTLQERVITVDEARAAEALAVFSSSRGWRTAVAAALGVGRRIFRGEREGTHPPLIHGTGTQRTAGRLLVDEDGPLAEGALALLHGGWIVDLVRHQASHARGERSPQSSEGCCVSLNLPRGPRTRTSDPGRNEALPSGGLRPCGRPSSTPPRGACACREGCTRAPVRAASSSPTCCTRTASFRKPGSAQTRPDPNILFGRGSVRTDAPRNFSSATFAHFLPPGPRTRASGAALNTLFERTTWSVHSGSGRTRRGRGGSCRTCSRRSEAESWLTLLDERPHALALIGRPEELTEQIPLGREARRTRGEQGGADGGLGGGERLPRSGGERRASATAVSSTCAAGTTRSTSPRASAWSAGTCRPV